MSGIEGHNGYYLKKTGERVNELLSRQFIVPTLREIPTETTLTWEDGEYVVEFRVGEMCRVYTSKGYKLYKLINIANNVAEWQEDNTGGVEIVTDKEYETLKANGDIVPNFIYLVTKNNRAEKLYIGTILIAKRDETTDTGFAYTFPIIF